MTRSGNAASVIGREAASTERAARAERDERPPGDPSATAGPRVLVVYDTAQMKGALSLLLSDDGFSVHSVAAGDDVPAALAELRPDLILLHSASAGADPLSFLARIRQQHDEPVIVLSSRATPDDRVRGLELGADDYVATPFDPDELTARIRAVLRRSERHRSAVPPMVVGELTIDFERRILTRDAAVVPLGRTEWLVLRHLARYPGKVVLNTELLSAIWGDGYADDLQVLRICISRLRQKLGATSRGGGPIRTFHNVGYALEVE